jgi:hypothetical protein
LVHLHKVKQAFQTVQISTGADHSRQRHQGQRFFEG